MFSRTSRILLVVAAVAAIVYLLVARGPGPDRDGAPVRLAEFEPGRVDQIVLEREHETLHLARADSVWQLTAPMVDRAERNAVASLLDALEHADVARNLGPVEDLAPFGLDRPLVRITLLAGTDTLLHASVGKRTVDEAWCYARAASSRDLLLVPTHVARAATQPVASYRSQRVVDFQLADVSRYTLAAGARTMGWRKHNGRWSGASMVGDTATFNDGVPGDSIAVESILRRLRGLRVAQFLAANDSLLSGARFAGSIALWGPGHAPLASLSFLRLRDTRWAAREHHHESQRIVVVDDDIADLFEHTTLELRERRLIQFSPADAEGIEVVLPGASGSIVRAGTAWAFPNPAAGRVDPDRAADLVRALRALKWTDLPPKGAPKALDPARFFIAVTGADGTILDELRADSRDGALWYVTSRSSRGVWMIERQDLDAIADRFAQLRAP